MKTKTNTISIGCEPGKVFDFVSKPENLPRWASGFCRSIRKDASGWIVDSPQGEIGIRFETNEHHGIVDFYLRPVGAPGEGLAASRVIPNGEGSEYIFTMFQGPGVSDELFVKQDTVLQEELLILKKVLESGKTSHVKSSCA